MANVSVRSFRCDRFPVNVLSVRTAPMDGASIRSVAALTRPVVRALPLRLLQCCVRSIEFGKERTAGPDTEAAVRELARGISTRQGTGKGHQVEVPDDVLNWKDRLYYSLLPPIDMWIQHRTVRLPFEPFPYQKRGIAFLVPRRAALLADEMGLGKTMQAIVAARLAMAAGLIRSVLLICPKPLVSNWVREFSIWASDLPVVVVEGSSARRRSIWSLHDCPVRIANYELLVRDIELIERLGVTFDLVVLDEAQRIKNHSSRTAQAARRLRRKRSWALTGTPVENRTEDLLSIFSFLQPGMLPSESTPAAVRAATEPYILRRLKEHVLDDMPERIIRDAFVDLGPQQHRSYWKAKKEGVLRLNQMGDSVKIQNVFELVLRLKQICNFDPVTGESSKLEQLREDLAEIAASGRKAVVFSQWVRTLQRLRAELREFNPVEFHGAIPPRERQANLDRFRNGPHTVLLISYGAGSVGLNLQFAQYLFLFDRWWNPAVEDQAINRVHRIGQREPVIITRFIVKNTVEERIAEVLQEKRELIAQVVPQTEHEAGLQKIWTQDDIFRLVDLEPRKKRDAA